MERVVEAARSEAELARQDRLNEVPVGGLREVIADLVPGNPVRFGARAQAHAPPEELGHEEERVPLTCTTPVLARPQCASGGITNELDSPVLLQEGFQGALRRRAQRSFSPTSPAVATPIRVLERGKTPPPPGLVADDEAQRLIEAPERGPPVPRAI